LSARATADAKSGEDGESRSRGTAIARQDGADAVSDGENGEDDEADEKSTRPESAAEMGRMRRGK